MPPSEQKVARLSKLMQNYAVRNPAAFNSHSTLLFKYQREVARSFLKFIFRNLSVRAERPSALKKFLRRVHLKAVKNCVKARSPQSKNQLRFFASFLISFLNSDAKLKKPNIVESPEGSEEIDSSLYEAFLLNRRLQKLNL
jgi:hypothetical protein